MAAQRTGHSRAASLVSSWGGKFPPTIPVSNGRTRTFAEVVPLPPEPACSRVKRGVLQFPRASAAARMPRWPGYFIPSRERATPCSLLPSSRVIARSAATTQSIWLDRHALVPRARDDKLECEFCGAIRAYPPPGSANASHSEAVDGSASPLLRSCPSFAAWVRPVAR